MIRKVIPLNQGYDKTEVKSFLCLGVLLAHRSVKKDQDEYQDHSVSMMNILFLLQQTERERKILLRFSDRAIMMVE